MSQIHRNSNDRTKLDPIIELEDLESRDAYDISDDETSSSYEEYKGGDVGPAPFNSSERTKFNDSSDSDSSEDEESKALLPTFQISPPSPKPQPQGIKRPRRVIVNVNFVPETERTTRRQGDAQTPSETAAPKPQEEGYSPEDFPSRDSRLALNTIRRQSAARPLAIKPWCVRDISWLESEFDSARRQPGDDESDYTLEEDEVKYTPYPHMPPQGGFLNESLGVAPVRPDDPHWEGPDPSNLRKIDTWFLAGAQHCLRSRSFESPAFFLRFGDTEAFESRIIKILDTLAADTSKARAFDRLRKGITRLKRAIRSRLGVDLHLDILESWQGHLQPEKRRYLEICRMTCFNLKRLRYWLWRESNSDYQTFTTGSAVLSKIVHETLETLERLDVQDVHGSLYPLKHLRRPLVPAYKNRDQLIETAEEKFAINQSTAGEHLSYLAVLAFQFHGHSFDRWPDIQLQAYVENGGDRRWRTLDLRYIEVRSSNFMISPERPEGYKTSMAIGNSVKHIWKEQMRIILGDIPRGYKNAFDTFYFKPQFQPLDSKTLDQMWDNLTAGEDLYTYQAPRSLRRTKSMPKLQAQIHRKLPGQKERLWDDQDRSNLGFGVDRLPARPSPRLYNGRPPGYPEIKEHELGDLQSGLTGHSFIVIGYFPTKLLDPIEVCLWYSSPETFLSELKNEMNRLRGWRRYLSLKTVQGFGLYKCSIKNRVHSIVTSSPTEHAVLQQLYTACSRQSMRQDPIESADWANWVTSELNNWGRREQRNNSFYFPMPMESHLSLRLKFRWSRYRLVLASTVTMTLSLFVGFYYMAVEGDPQTAWTVSGYVITGGAFLIAVLAVWASLQDGDEDVKKSVVTQQGVRHAG